VEEKKNTGFMGYPGKAVEFFKGIRENNNRDWFEPRKQDYIKYCVKPTWDLINDLAPDVLKIDPNFQTDPSKMISRIYRDIRFSKDKTPYKSRLWFSLKRPGVEWQDAPGYYFEISHDSYGFGMGMYAPSKETMQNFRQAIVARPEEFLKAISFLRSKKNIFSIGGESYKRPPKENVDKRILKWYMMKNFYFYCEKPVDNVVFSPKLADELILAFKTLAPLYRYLWEIKGV
jgi:uncharacterized protein (TIGR02453 family)